MTHLGPRDQLRVQWQTKTSYQYLRDRILLGNLLSGFRISMHSKVYRPLQLIQYCRSNIELKQWSKLLWSNKLGVRDKKASINVCPCVAQESNNLWDHLSCLDDADNFILSEGIGSDIHMMKISQNGVDRKVLPTFLRFKTNVWKENHSPESSWVTQTE